jgi:hypothetical protein
MIKAKYTWMDDKIIEDIDVLKELRTEIYWTNVLNIQPIGLNSSTKCKETDLKK